MNDDPTDDPATRVAELEARLAEVEAAAQARIIQAELRAEAVRAGMVDLDGLKLLDASGLALGADGAVEGAAALMRQMRQAKPWLFAAASSSSTAAAPATEPPQAKRASEMSEEEWRAARADLLRRR